MPGTDDRAGGNITQPGANTFAVSVDTQVRDADDNISAKATDNVIVAETLPTVSIAAVDDDDVINNDEANAAGGVPLSGFVTGVKVGSTFPVSVTDGSFSATYTSTVDSVGTGWTATIPEADATTLPNGTATVSAQVIDTCGNMSALATDEVTVAESVPTVTISAVEGDGMINYADAKAAAGVPLSGTVIGLAAGSTFAVLVDDGLFSASYSATVDAAGTGWTADIPEADAIIVRGQPGGAFPWSVAGVPGGRLRRTRCSRCRSLVRPSACCSAEITTPRRFRSRAMAKAARKSAIMRRDPRGGDDASRATSLGAPKCQTKPSTHCANAGSRT